MKYYAIAYSDEYIEHHGIKGMKWGVRRYQNPDGSLTAAGKKRYYVTDSGEIKKISQYNYREDDSYKTASSSKKRQMTNVHDNRAEYYWSKKAANRLDYYQYKEKLPYADLKKKSNAEAVKAFAKGAAYGLGLYALSGGATQVINGYRRLKVYNYNANVVYSAMAKMAGISEIKGGVQLNPKKIVRHLQFGKAVTMAMMKGR